MRLIIEIGTKVISLSLDFITKKKSKSLKIDAVKQKTVLRTELNPILYRNLRHLEFISKLETNYSINQLRSITYLQDLNSIKLEAQKNTLKLFNCKVA